MFLGAGAYEFVGRSAIRLRNTSWNVYQSWDNAAKFTTQINESHITALYTHLKTRVETGQIKASYAAKVFDVLKAFFRFAYRQGYLETLPRNIDISIHFPPSSVTHFTIEQIRQILFFLSKSDPKAYCEKPMRDMERPVTPEKTWKSWGMTRKTAKTKSRNDL